jgi:transcriptional regulator with XRE-family HTH domain
MVMKMDECISKKIGSRIKELREEKGISQKELSKVLNIASSNISKYETGSLEINFETLLNLSKYFDVSLDYIFCSTDVRKEDDLKIDIGYFTVSQEAYEKGITPEQLKAAMDFYMSVVKDVISKENKNNK